jgi:hypothetical protein
MWQRVLLGCLGLPLLLLSSAHRGWGQLSGESQLDRANAFGGSALTCSQQQIFAVPRAMAERAKLKARLMNLPRESLYDDAKGVVNIAREKEIRKLANKLKNDKAE